MTVSGRSAQTDGRLAACVRACMVGGNVKRQVSVTQVQRRPSQRDETPCIRARLYADVRVRV